MNVSAFKLTKTRVECTQYAIVGKYASGSRDFVAHAALLKVTCDVSVDKLMGVWECGPPIVGTENMEGRFGENKCIVSVVADLRLVPTERDAVANFLQGVEKQYRSRNILPFQQYKLIPHADWVIAPETGRRIRRRFSCCGFVIEAYADAGIVLLDTYNLPAAELRDVEAAYPSLIRLTNCPEKIQRKFGFLGLDDIGLGKNAPWQLALPGYLFHACDGVDPRTVDAPFVAPSVKYASFPLEKPAPPLAEERNMRTRD